jgi:hypothetical protein
MLRELTRDFADEPSAWLLQVRGCYVWRTVVPMTAGIREFVLCDRDSRGWPTFGNNGEVGIAEEFAVMSVAE